jgi:hypothetical protein
MWRDPEVVMWRSLITNNEDTILNKQNSNGGKIRALALYFLKIDPLYKGRSASFYKETDKFLHFENSLVWNESFQNVLS